MQRRISLPQQHMSPAIKLLMLTQYAVAVVNVHPAFKFIEGGWQVLVPTLSLAISLMMGLVFTDYNPIQQTVSQMVHYPHGWLLTADFVVLSVWLLILAAKFYYVFARRKESRISSLILLLTAIGFILIAIFPTNLENTNKNTAAWIHEYAARSIAVLFPMACFLLLPQLFSNLKQRWLAVYTLLTGVLGLVFVFICAAVIFNDGVTLGLFERILMCNALVWGMVVGIRLFSIQFKIPTRMTR